MRTRAVHKRHLRRTKADVCSAWKDRPKQMDVQKFIDQFLPTPPGKPPTAIRDRFEHWREVHSHPEKFTEDTSRFALAAKRKYARCALRRLAKRYPDVAASFVREVSQ